MTGRNCPKCGKPESPVFISDALFDFVCMNCYELAKITRKVK